MGERGTSAVIPGHAAGMSPEPGTAGLSGRSCFGVVFPAKTVVMGSGLFALRSPGMTTEVRAADREAPPC